MSHTIEEVNVLKENVNFCFGPCEIHIPVLQCIPYSRKVKFNGHLHIHMHNSKDNKTMLNKMQQITGSCTCVSMAELMSKSFMKKNLKLLL